MNPDNQPVVFVGGPWSGQVRAFRDVPSTFEVAQLNDTFYLDQEETGPYRPTYDTLQYRLHTAIDGTYYYLFMGSPKGPVKRGRAPEGSTTVDS